MRAQLKSLGLSLDWSREIATCDPTYYKHQQKLFLDFLAGGLVDRKKSKVNWDPVDHTVLANEQVIDGRGWRSGAPVEQRELTQWFLKISAAADDLLAALDDLPRWPEKVRLMQKNWIGKSEGLHLRFALAPSDKRAAGEIDVYTTRPDTLFGAKFIALAPDHPLAASGSRRPIRRSPPSSPSASAAAHPKRRSRRRRKRATTPGSRCAIPFDADWLLPGLCRQFRADGLRHRRDFRLPGA